MNTLLIFVLAFLVADRFSGGGFGWEKISKDHGGPIGGRPIYYALLALLIGLYPLGWQYSVMALGFGIWRLDGWKGVLAPSNAKETFKLFTRHLQALVLVPLAYFAKFDWKIAAVAVVIWAALAAVVAYIGAKKQTPTFDANAYIEMVRGALFGGMFWVITQ